MIALALTAAAICSSLWLLSPAGVVVPSFEQVRTAWRPSESWLLDRHGEPLQSLRVAMDGRRLAWTPLDDVSPALITAVVTGEDRRFLSHRGVDWPAVAGSALDWLSGQAKRGASTITMQLAAFIDSSLRPARGRRSIVQKLTQMRMARRLEARWSKQQILEAYLNLAGFRGELQGVHAAARGLFGKAPAGLSEDESYLLAALLPAPTAAPAEVAARACRLRDSSNERRDCPGLERLAQVALNGSLKPGFDAALAPHLGQRLLREPGVSVITSLDRELQRQVRDLLRQRLGGLIDSNVRDGAALVVDNASGEVLAWVGSAGPASRAAQVDGVRARRQAGSTLKPFLYGLAIERRFLTAASVLEDAPLNLDTRTGLYIPQNYDRDFKGLVSVRTALAASLNVPAVRTLVLTGVEAFRDRLYEFGYAGISKAGAYYGYSLALGSAEVSLLEQVGAYRALARGGIVGPLSVFPNAAVGEGRRIMPAEVAYLIADILSDRAARAPTFGLDSPLSTRYWSAVKTGTSKDMRDNWCIGFSSAYTVGVWVGNFEGDSMHDVSGITGAAPMWQEIMNALHAMRPPAAPVVPEGLVASWIRYEPLVEAPRREWFLQGTETELVAIQTNDRSPARIVSPANGVIIAVDPDIPLTYQRIMLQAEGDTNGYRLVLDGFDLGLAGKVPQWRPVTGIHRLELIDGAGGLRDAVHFTVRGLR
jgi:penicillin-binding protein 1C